jgi:hypothetical protein
MNITTRTALADEKPAIWRLYENAMKHHIEAIWGWDAAWQIADFEKAFAASSTYVVEVDGRFSEARRLSVRPDITPASKAASPLAGTLVRASPAAKKEKATARK